MKRFQPYTVGVLVARGSMKWGMTSSWTYFGSRWRRCSTWTLGLFWSECRTDFSHHISRASRGYRAFHILLHQYYRNCLRQGDTHSRQVTSLIRLSPTKRLKSSSQNRHRTFEYSQRFPISSGQRCYPGESVLYSLDRIRIEESLLGSCDKIGCIFIGSRRGTIQKVGANNENHIVISLRSRKNHRIISVGHRQLGLAFRKHTSDLQQV